MTDSTATAPAAPDTLPAWAKSWPKWIQPYLRPEMASMLLLGFASGLPLYLVYQKTSFWMRESGVELSTIGFFYWVGMFYSFKFVWAPITDKLDIPWLTQKLGHRRSWMVAAMSGTVLALFIIAASNPAEGIITIVLGAMLLAFAGATLDVSIDAWRIESAPSERQANMAASYSLGYRGALIFSNLGLVIAGFSNWHFAFVVMALAMAGSAAMILLIREPSERRAQEDIHDLPIFAGAWNAIAIATALFVFARVFKLLKFDLAVLGGFPLIWIVYGLVTAAIAILLLGPMILSGTKSSLPLRAAIAGVGAVFVFAWQLAFQVMQPAEDGPPVFKLLVVLISLTAVAAYGWLVLHAIMSGRPVRSGSAEDQPRGKLFVMFGTPFLQVWERFGKIIIPIMGFVMIYRLSDFTMGVMAIPLYADLGYAKEVVGALQGGPGVLSTIIGLFIGGAFANWLGVRPSLIVGGALTLVTNGFYAFFAAHASGTDPQFLALAICADNVAGGFVTTVFIAYLSSLVDPAYAATQYALFSSVYAMVNKFVAGFSGVMAESVGYVWFFLITACYAIPAVLLVLLIMRIQPNGPPPVSEDAA